MHFTFYFNLFKTFLKPAMAGKTSSHYEAIKFGTNKWSLFTCTWEGTWWPAELCRRPLDAGNCWRGTGSCAPSEQRKTDREHSRFLQRQSERSAEPKNISPTSSVIYLTTQGGDYTDHIWHLTPTVAVLMKLICCLAFKPAADCLTKLSEKLGHAAAAHRQGVVYGRLDNLPVARAERYGPL